jgi:hypothetical protein
VGNTLRTELAESAFIVGTFDFSLLWVRVQALVTSGAVSVLGEPPTLWHAPEVVLVEKLTSISFLTEPPKPVLTDSGKSFPVSRMGWQLFWWLEI